MDNWRDRDLTEVLDRLDYQDYYTDQRRQRPILTRREARQAEAEERKTAFYTWLMIDRYSDYCPLAYHD